MYRGYIFSVILVILSLLGITGLPSECFADICSELFFTERGTIARPDYNIPSEIVFTDQGKKYFPREGFADNISSEVSTGSFYSIDEKLEMMSDAIKTEEWLDEKEKLEKKLSNIEKRIEKLYIIYKTDYKGFISKKKELKELEREYKSLKRQIEQNDKRK